MINVGGSGAVYTETDPDGCDKNTLPLYSLLYSHFEWYI